MHGYELISRQTENGVWCDDLRPLQGARLWQLRDMYRRGQRHRSRQQPESLSGTSPSCAAVPVSTATLPSSRAPSVSLPVAVASVPQSVDATLMPPPAQPTLPASRLRRIVDENPVPADYLSSDDSLSSYSEEVATGTWSEIEADLSPAQLMLTDELNSRRTLRRRTSTVETDEDLNEIYGADVGFLGTVLPDLFPPLPDTITRDDNNNDMRASTTRTTTEISVVTSDVMYTIVPMCMPIVNVESVPVSSVATASISTSLMGSTTHSVGVQADTASGDWRVRFNPSLASEILCYYLHADPLASVNTLVIRTMRALNLHPTDWVSFEIIEAIAIGMVESDRLSARNQLSLLVPCVNNPAMAMFCLTADIHRRLARPRELGGIQSPAQVIPTAALPEPIIILDMDEEV